MSDPTPRTGGRPTAAAAALLETLILDHATAAFLRDGYAATSIDAISRVARVAKRTIYARWDGKPALFLAVVRRLVANWLSTTETWPETDDVEAMLGAVAKSIVSVGLTPEAIALHRLMIAETPRFPELQKIVADAGVQAGIDRIAGLLRHWMAVGKFRAVNPEFAAEQFLHVVLDGPRNRALGLRPRLTEAETDRWCRDAVRLFLTGCLAPSDPAGD